MLARCSRRGLLYLTRRAKKFTVGEQRERPPRLVEAARTQEPDYYAILGLAAGSSAEQVRAQYRRLAKQHHPDLRGSETFWQDHFKKINAARDFLSDPARKAAYDQRLMAQEARR